MAKQKIIPCLWFDNNAQDAVKLYTKAFKKSKTIKVSRYSESMSNASGQKKGSVMMVEFNILGQTFTALNGGPFFKQNPSTSLMVKCKTAAEVNRLYKALKPSEVMMELSEYPFSKRYAFFKDKYGVSWQLILHPSGKEHIAYSLLFVGQNYGRANDAIKLYKKVFKKTKMNSLVYYKKDDQFGNKKGTVMHASMNIFDQDFVLMDGAGPHKFEFNDAFSFMVYCKDQKEVDYYWNSLMKGGGHSEQCGWLRDKFGVPWQIIPIQMMELMYGNKSNPKKSEAVMKVMLSMVKMDIKTLEKAYKEA